MLSAEYTIPGMHMREHRVAVPLDWSDPDGAQIEIFAREVVDPVRRSEALPLLVYLQGGPGGKSPRPTNRDGWLGAALKRFRVILFDQRGTGRSSRVQADQISAFADPAAAAAHLLHFRADSIVRDLEHLRHSVFGGVQWQTLGQSYGGFITLSYLSTAPEALAACFIAGGLASVHPSAERTYQLTYPRVQAKTARFYERYPHDEARIAAVADHIEANDTRLPDGDRLSVRRLQSLGLDLGMGPGAERLHWLFDEAFLGESPAERGLSDTFLAQVMARTSFSDNPLFAIMQESIYAEGGAPTAWAAERERARHPSFDPARRPLAFTGEMMYPWMFDEIRSLRPFRAAAEALAATEHHSPLYDRPRLAGNEVPILAAVYDDDMYVDSGLSRATAAEVGGITAWITNEFEHDGLHGSVVAERLFTMLDERGGAR
ncbi:MAG: alpha/beta fold hydrolase [Cryobacterium sp.]